MKEKFTIVMMAALATVSLSFGQQSIQHDAKLTEGKIVFDVAYPDAQPSGTIASEILVARTVYFRNDRMRIETKMAGGHTDVILVDCKNKIATALNEVSGKKHAVVSTNDEVQKEATSIPHLELKSIDDFKEIAGYNCQKNDFLLTDKNQSTLKCEIYTNHNIVLTNPNCYSPQFREISDFMLEYSIRQNGITVKFTAKSIEAFKENENIFNVPSGYKQVSKEEFKNAHPISSN